MAASHHAALALHEVPLHGVDLEHVDLVADVERTRSKAGVSTHPVRSSHVVDVRGCRVVELPAALCQVAAASGTAAAVVGMDAALHRRACTRPDLERAAASSATPDAASVLVAVAATDSASESVGESLARLLLVDLGFAVRSQVPLSRGGSVVARVDFLVDGLVVVEFDGAVKYAGADGRDALVAEKRRESELVDLGYEVVRLTWADLERPEVVLAKVRAALRRASMRRTA